MIMNIIFAATFLAVCAASSDVIDTTDATFDEVVKSSPLVLMEFYAPWCGHCKKLEPEWDTAATQLKGVAVLAKVDATVETINAKKVDVRGYPSIHVYRNGEHIGDYKGPRSADGIVAWVKENSGPAVVSVETEEELETLKKEATVVVSFETAEDLHSVFETVAERMRSKYRFVSAKSELATNDHKGKIVIFKNFDEKINVFTGESSANDVSAFVTESGMRLFDEIGPENFRGYVDRALPIGWLFAADDEVSVAAKSVVEGLAAEFKGKLSLVWINSGKYSGMAQKLGLKGAKFPSFAISHEEKHYPFSEASEITAESIRSHLRSYVDGQLDQSVKSEAPPAEHTVKGLTTVVGSTFDELVVNADVDVLVEFYAPWCGHCKTLAPKYDTLAEKLENVQGIRIAKLDATANDYAKKKFHVEGFPTLMLMKKGTENPITFDGDRDTTAMYDWLKENSDADFSSTSAGSDEL